jgi:adenylate cyclase
LANDPPVLFRFTRVASYRYVCLHMAKKFEYTTLAYRYTARFPLATYVGTQVNFWIIANILLVTMAHLQLQMMSHIYDIKVTPGFGTMLLFAVIAGILYGVSLGLAGHYVEKKILRKESLGKVILIKAFASFVVLVLILALLRHVVFIPFIFPSLNLRTPLTEELWETMFLLLVIYYFFMNVVISFVNQINRKYGPGILLPLLLGRYRNPREEDRIFIFMDLKSSTATAERLGHLRYSAFIRDCFSDINEVLYPFQAQVYQYVGDEIVLTWHESEGLKNHSCIAFYFSCKKQFEKRADYYMNNYGFLPDFKAGAHTGTVTAVEIGDVKRDIAYHGDTLNTASRIQRVCNEYNKSFLVSKDLIDKVGRHPTMQVQELGMVLLKGKTSKVGIYNVEWDEPSTHISSVASPANR